MVRLATWQIWWILQTELMTGGVHTASGWGLVSVEQLVVGFCSCWRRGCLACQACSNFMLLLLCGLACSSSGILLWTFTKASWHQASKLAGLCLHAMTMCHKLLSLASLLTASKAASNVYVCCSKQQLTLYARSQLLSCTLKELQRSVKEESSFTACAAAYAHRRQSLTA